MTEAELLEALEAALRVSDGEVELSAQAGRQGTTRFAGSRVTQTGDVEDVTVQARVRQGASVGAARTNALDADSIARTIAQARAQAQAQASVAGAQSGTGFPGFADGGAAATAVPSSFDEATAVADASARAALVEPAFRAATRAGLSAAGLAVLTDSTLAVATRAGCRRSFRSTAARLDVIAADGNASARASRCATAIANLPAAEVAAEACEGALRGRDPIELPPGAYDVILEPAAVAEVLEWLALTSFGARAIEEGSSCLAGRLGQRITGPITIYDDALSGDGGCPTLPFDAEGTPTRKVSFLSGGVAGGPVYDRASAARAGVEPTGHSPPLADDLFDGGAVPTHLHIAPGPDDTDALLARVERGLWVTRFHYVNGLLDTRRALMTGMTRDGLHLIENGKRTRPVRNLRWTESVLDAFTRLAGTTRTRQLIAAGLSDSVFVCPTLLLRAWTFTG